MSSFLILLCSWEGRSSPSSGPPTSLPPLPLNAASSRTYTYARRKADFLRNGHAKQIMGMSKEDTTTLWNAVQDGKRAFSFPFAGRLQKALVFLAHIIVSASKVTIPPSPRSTANFSTRQPLSSTSPFAYTFPRPHRATPALPIRPPPHRRQGPLGLCRPSSRRAQPIVRSLLFLIAPYLKPSASPYRVALN
jgi:hypothetical protein